MYNSKEKTLDFDNNNNSIFENINNAMITPPHNIEEETVDPQKETLLGNVVNNIKNKFQKIKNEKQYEENLKALEEMLQDKSDILTILKSFDCKIIIISLELVEITSAELDITGFINIKNDIAEPDENCKKLFQLISTIIAGGYRIEDILNKYEEEDFYPIGEITPIKIKYKGNEITASKGLLANPQGEIKTIIFYKGYEIKPDEENDEEDKTNKIETDIEDTNN